MEETIWAQTSFLVTKRYFFHKILIFISGFFFPLKVTIQVFFPCRQHPLLFSRLFKGSKHILSDIFPFPSPSSEMFVCSHPHDKHPSQAGFCFAGPYQTALEPGSSSTPSLFLFYPRIFGSGSCLCSAEQFTLESRWSEIFQAETHLDQAANN